MSDDPSLRRKREKIGDFRPDAMVGLPTDEKELIRRCLETVEQCRQDVGARLSQCKSIHTISSKGTWDGTQSLMNLLENFLDRLASHLFSPAEIRFAMDFENEYRNDILQRGALAARLLQRSWERTNTDILFAQGVFESLKYGSCFLKQTVKQAGEDKLPVYGSYLIMPWQMGVYQPYNNSLDAQPAIVETTMLSLPEVWRRIWHLPGADRLFARIKETSAPGASSELDNSFFHQIMSTSQLQTSSTSSVRPGGVVQLSSNTDFSNLAATSGAPLVKMHEIWMWAGEDYAMIQIIDPDILVTRYKLSNVLVPGSHPYTLIQPNQTNGSIWGRSEIADLAEIQSFLSTTAYDIRRLFGLQVDKIFGFMGEDDITDERYAQFRTSGFVNMGPNSKIEDLTPTFPAESIPLLDKIIQIMEMISGFDNLMSGRGEPGVRSGEQMTPMLKVAGARMKDRSLVVERQCAAAADLRMSIMEAKDGRQYWTDPDHVETTSFLLSDLPDDRRIVVDGHTTSPIFADDHQSLLIAGLKLGLIDKESAIEQLPFQNRDIILNRLHAAEKKQQALLEQLQHKDPEGFMRMIEKSGHKK